jgi:hypothetical protein
LTNDPVRIAIIAARNFIEETVEAVIAEAASNSECFDVPNMRFSDKLKVFENLNLMALGKSVSDRSYRSSSGAKVDHLIKQILGTPSDPIYAHQVRLWRCGISM